MENIKQLAEEYETLKEQLKRVNYFIKVYAKTKHKKTYVMERNRIQKRLNQIYETILEYKDKAFIDKSPFSYVSLSKRTGEKPRYIKIDGKTQQDMNFSLIYIPKSKELYYIEDKNIQLTKHETQLAYKYLTAKYGNEILLVTDKRHNLAFQLPKTETMIIERQLSRIKKRVYNNLLRNIKTREDLLKLYHDVFRELNIKQIA
jgi:hypothetical protein